MYVKDEQQMPLAEFLFIHNHYNNLFVLYSNFSISLYRYVMDEVVAAGYCIE